MPYREHGDYTTPPDDETLWRYMSTHKFASLLAEAALFFVRIDQLEDEYEGSAAKPYRASRAKYNGKELNSCCFEALEIDLRERRRFTLVNCWQRSTHESDAMWRLYCPDKEGIAVKTTVGSLKHSLLGAEPVFIGEVLYSDYDEPFVRTAPAGQASFTMGSPAVRKRHHFEYEQEVRAVIDFSSLARKSLHQCGVALPLISPDAPDICEKGVFYPVDLSTLIKEVVLSPYAGAALEPSVKRSIRASGLNIPVRRSSMARVPHYRSVELIREAAPQDSQHSSS